MPEPGLFAADGQARLTPPSLRGAPGPSFVSPSSEGQLDLSGGLTYRATPDLAVGDRVEVPLGRGDKPAAGFVVRVGGPELLDGYDPRKVKRVLGPAGASLPPDLVELGEWLASYYLCPLGMTLATMMPAAVKARVGRRTERRVEPTETTDADPADDLKLSKSARCALDALRALPADTFPIDRHELARLVGAPNARPINDLLRAKLLREVDVEVVRAPEAFWETRRVEAAAAPPTLTPDQSTVVEGVARTFDAFAVHLLRGVTGSGKTEVYLRLIDRVLAAGKSAIVLVPEIALTPQTAGRFLDRFAHHGVAVLHSGLSASARHRQWRSAASGAARVIVGARSAVFAPAPNLGLIVVDEEHDQGYKQDQLPRYHARDVAVKRAHLLNIPVLLGSATPALESWLNAKRGRYALWELPTRVAGARLPKVHIVDLLQERRTRREQAGRDPRTLESIGPTLAAALERTLDAGGQAILLLNRRGYASYVACPDTACGWSLGCDHCDVKMVVHGVDGARGRHVRCHHCLAAQLVPKACPVCGKQTIGLGAGTQRVERELEQRFGTTCGLVEGDTLVRVDSDTMNKASDYFDVLERFGRGEVKVILGTQMVAKGLDYPNVRLVGVINADTAMALPDFRAAERTFQLVSQVAGRTGRGELPGEVIVQTTNPAEPAIRLAAAHDYPTFADRELEFRAASRLPPAWRMVRVVVRDEDVGKAESQAAAIAKACRERAGEGVIVQGPAPCPISRVAGFFRFGVELSARSPKEMQDVLAELRGEGVVRSDAHTAVDVDPVALL
ncbi:MAG: primosomal protein N' [Phycisphaerales bacterium]